MHHIKNLINIFFITALLFSFSNAQNIDSIDIQLKKIEQEIKKLKSEIKKEKLKYPDFKIDEEIIKKNNKIFVKSAKNMYVFVKTLDHYLLKANAQGIFDLTELSKYINNLIKSKTIYVPEELKKYEGIDLTATFKIPNPSLTIPYTIEGFQLKCNGHYPYILKDKNLNLYRIKIGNYFYSIAGCYKKHEPIKFYLIKEKSKLK